VEPEQIPESLKEKPAITISVQSWATPIVGLVMLIVGLFGGYALRPHLDDQTTQQPDVSLRQQPSQDSVAGNPQLMEYLVSQTRHFRGDPDAPVTLIEFGDFQ